MIIHKIEGADRASICDCIKAALTDSRFRCSLYSITHARYREAVDIKCVRLKSRKEFCGNHPNECVIGGKDKKASFLEGADWVEFNDTINDVLDRMGVSAEVFSKPLEIKKRLFVRHGRKRRIAYYSEPIPGIGPDSRFFGATQWVHDDPECYQDCIGEEAPRSDFPDGTPGIYAAKQYDVVG